MLVSLALAAGCAAPVAPFVSQDAAGGPTADTAAPLESRIRTVALFKNGFAFVQREAMAPAGARSVRMQTLPVPVHGTFWIAGDPERVKVGAATARKDSLVERSPALTVEEILRANVGRKLTLLLTDKESLTGKLVAMPAPQPAGVTPLVPPPPGGFYYPGYELAGGPVTNAPRLLILETAGGTVALSPGDVRRVAADGEPLALEIERSREGSSLTLDLEPRGAGEIPLSLLYLERGLTWAPSYAIDLSDPEHATLTAKADVLDDAEDLEGATLQLVTGFPNLRFSHVVSPVAMRGDLDSFLRALAGDGQDQRQSVLSQTVVSNWAMPSDAGSTFPTADAPAEGLSAEDLFLYEVPGVTLKRGERGIYPLFSVRVPYEHVYEWDIPDTLNTSQRYQPEEPDVVDIWHSVRLTNDGGVPWTTAPAMTMSDGHLLGQDMLAYTPVGARRTVRITRAVDVQGDRAEFEVARDRNAASFYGSSYDKVTVRGEIQVTNRKAEAIGLEITKHVQGEVSANPDEATVVAVAEGLRRVNPTTRLTWSVPLEAGEARTLTYTYTLFLRP